jgi:hypothetical protein
MSHIFLSFSITVLWTYFSVLHPGVLITRGVGEDILRGKGWVRRPGVRATARAGEAWHLQASGPESQGRVVPITWNGVPAPRVGNPKLPGGAVGHDVSGRVDQNPFTGLLDKTRGTGFPGGNRPHVGVTPAPERVDQTPRSCGSHHPDGWTRRTGRVVPITPGRVDPTTRVCDPDHPGVWSRPPGRVDPTTRGCGPCYPRASGPDNPTYPYLHMWILFKEAYE